MNVSNGPVPPPTWFEFADLPSIRAYSLPASLFLGRLRKVDLIILEGKNVCPSVRPYVRPSTKSFFNLNESWYIGRGRRVMQDGMPYGRIEGQGQGHEPFKV